MTNRRWGPYWPLGARFEPFRRDFGMKSLPCDARRLAAFASFDALRTLACLQRYYGAVFTHPHLVYGRSHTGHTWLLSLAWAGAPPRPPLLAPRTQYTIAPTRNTRSGALANVRPKTSMRSQIQTGRIDSGVVCTRPRGHTRVIRSVTCYIVRGHVWGVVRGATLRQCGRRWEKDLCTPVDARSGPS